MSTPTETTQATREEVQALAEAFVSRMTWPSAHWSTQRLDYDAAVALAKVALDHAPNIIAVARAKEQAITQVLNAEVTR